MTAEAALPTPASVPPSEEARQWLEDVIRYADKNPEPVTIERAKYATEISTFLETAARPASIEVEQSPQTAGGSIETSALLFMREDSKIIYAMTEILGYARHRTGCMHLEGRICDCGLSERFKELATALGGRAAEKGDDPSTADTAIPQKPACDDVPGVLEQKLIEVALRDWRAGSFGLEGSQQFIGLCRELYDRRANLGTDSPPAAPSTQPKSVSGGSAPEQGGGKTEAEEKLIASAIEASTDYNDKPTEEWLSAQFRMRSAAYAVKSERERAGGGE